MANKYWFEDRGDLIDMDDVDARCSYYGNDFITITKEQLLEMEKGKILYHSDDEYGTFIMIEEKEVI